MKAILMAAGVGSRISRHIDGKPKCLLEVNGNTLIERTCRLLREFGVYDISVVVGYRSELIVECLGDGVKFYKNPFYRVTNSIASLWFAKQELETDEDVIVLNADLFFERNALERLINNNNKSNNSILLADSSRIEDADYRFNYQGNHLLKYGKELSVEETTGEYVGIGLLSGTMIKKFRESLIELVEVKGDNGLWWENVIYNFVPNESLIYVEDIKGIFWAEMDYIEDYERTLDYVSKYD
ncbi:NTP transferase domain-containing protein [Vibrio ostreicida]|uniref:Phosphocholine cytidylyltransferase family protein n=1 Tax=Vibrio ostreicida TaxID=526588 RepID=A0ABT8BQS7_9VIBR|nr:phosphocholine cytidylyltransferase family protein [Vibrio ostreicida]MDN3608482.1 phosphocholine cytidylyltransferase family protein [Vibrio ostreicida]NPD10304.1 phosphocholine cytidylyltransferase family protein [Vibrio ostreicida]